MRGCWPCTGVERPSWSRESSCGPDFQLEQPVLQRSRKIARQEGCSPRRWITTPTERTTCRSCIDPRNVLAAQAADLRRAVVALHMANTRSGVRKRDPCRFTAEFPTIVQPRGRHEYRRGGGSAPSDPEFLAHFLHRSRGAHRPASAMYAFLGPAKRLLPRAR